MLNIETLTARLWTLFDHYAETDAPDFQEGAEFAARKAEQFPTVQGLVATLTNLRDRARQNGNVETFQRATLALLVISEAEAL